MLDESLLQIERALDPAEFMRVSRQWLVRESSVQSLMRTGSGYVVTLPGLDEPINVPRARVSSLKNRLNH